MERIPVEGNTQTPWTMADVIKSIIFIAIITALTLEGILNLRSLVPEEMATPLAMAGAFLAESSMLLAVWLFGVRKYRLRWSTLGFKPFDPLRAGILISTILLVSLSVNVVYVQAVNYLGLEALKPPPILPQFLTDTWRFALAIVLASVVAPLVEETFFRGYVFVALKARFGFWLAALGSAAIFTSAHVQAGVLIPIFVLGLLLAWLYHRAGSIWPCITLHFVYNSLALMVAYAVEVSGPIS